MTETPRQSGRRWRRVGVLLVFATVLMIGACSGLDLWARHRVDDEIARLEKKYGSLDGSTLRPAIVPPADNRARVAKAAAALVIQLYRPVTVDASSSVPNDLRAFVEANRPAISVAEGIRLRQQSSWEIDYRDRAEHPPLIELRALSDAIYVNALMLLDAGHADEAARAVTTGLAVSASLRQEPDLISQLIRIAIAPRHFDAIQRVVTRSEPSKAALEDVARWVEENRAPPPAQMGLRGDLNQVNWVMAQMENGRVDLSIATYLYPQSWPATPRWWMGPIARLSRPLIRLARLGYLEYTDRLLDVQAAAGKRGERPELPAPKRWDLAGRLTQMFTAGYSRVVETGDDFTSELSTTAVAIALRRFRLDHGAYPDDLSALVPVYLASLPVDPLTGRPAAYARQGVGFTLLAHPNPKKYQPALNWSVAK